MKDHNIIKPRLIQINNTADNMLLAKPSNKITLDGVKIIGNVFKYTATMVELRGMKFTLKNWVINDNGD